MSEESVQFLEETTTNRLEAFSDGVFAVAITLLALDLKVPMNSEQVVADLGVALLNNWLGFLAYIVSFMTILVLWVNHHAIFQLIDKTNHVFLLLNGLLLLVVTTVPFSTSLLVEYFPTPNKQVAQGMYCGIQLALAIIYNLMLVYATRRRRLLKSTIPGPVVTTFTRQYLLGPLLIGIAFIVNFINAQLSFGIVAALTLFFALPQAVTQSFLQRGRRVE